VELRDWRRSMQSIESIAPRPGAPDSRRRRHNPADRLSKVAVAAETPHEYSMNRRNLLIVALVALTFLLPWLWTLLTAK